MEHAGKVAVITGGARGFGYGMASAFADEGAAVAILDVDAVAAEDAAARLRDGKRAALAIACDVGDEHAVEAAFAQVESELGGVDYLLNNAALLSKRYSVDFSESPRADVRAVLETNVMGVINCALSARPRMAQRGGGAIVNLASIAGYSVAGPYGLSKLAVRGLTVSLAREFAGDGIRVNAVAPGLMATESVMADLPPEMVDHFVNDLQLLKRQGLPEDIVNAAMFLFSGKASFITGETLRVSGGFPLSV